MPVYAEQKKIVNPDQHSRVAVLGVSIESDLHQGENLKVICNWINESYDRCLIDLSDTLHRFNYSNEHGVSLYRAHQACKSIGSNWLIRNKRILNKFLSIPYRVRRWDENIDTIEFLSIRKDIGQIYQTNPEFKSAVKKDIKRYASRKSLSINDREFYQASESYLLEEIAAQIHIYDQYRGDFIYPGRQLYSIEFVRNNPQCFNFSEFTKSTYVRLVLHGQESSNHENTVIAA
jgi:tRNA-dependent cyclodipeptide synthase